MLRRLAQLRDSTGPDDLILEASTLRLTVLYRRLKSREHAEAFLDGRIFITTLQRCRTVEDAVRRDGGEGRLQHNTGLIHPALPNYEALLARAGYDPRHHKNAVINDCVSNEGIRDAWLLCTSTDVGGVDRERFGRYVIEVTQPLEFFAELSFEMIRSKRATQCTASAIVYGERVYVGLDLPVAPAPFVKPPCFQDEREVRFAWMHDESIAMDPMEITFPGVRRFLRLLP